MPLRRRGAAYIMWTFLNIGIYNKYNEEIKVIAILPNNGESFRRRDDGASFLINKI